MVARWLKEHSQGVRPWRLKCTDIAACFTNSLDLRPSSFGKLIALQPIMRHSFVLVALSVACLVTAGDFGTADCRCVRRLWVFLRDASPLIVVLGSFRRMLALERRLGCA